jgi:hypothetical protein
MIGEPSRRTACEVLGIECDFFETNIPNVPIVLLEAHRDGRGVFARAFCTEEFRQYDVVYDVGQLNASCSSVAGTLRDMHYQEESLGRAEVGKCLPRRLRGSTRSKSREGLPSC